MNDTQKLCDQLQETWDNGIPLSQAMDLKLLSFENNVLTTHATLAPNVNVHGTAFAGSLYSVQALSGWGMVWLQLKRLGLDASIVIASGKIEYLKPLRENLVTRCDFGSHQDAMITLRDTGKARFELECIVSGEAGLASRFTGDYAVMLR